MSASEARAFEDLTPRGQAGRLRALALDALRDYDLEVERCSFVATAFNTVFRVDATNGSTYALRVSPRFRIHADGCEELEAEWLAALRRDTDLHVPQVIPKKDGSVVAWVTAAGVPEPRSCVLFEWIGGRSLKQHVTPALVRETGRQTAVLHDHGVGYLSVAPPGALVADRVLYFGCDDRIGELRPRYGSALADAVVRAQEILDALWRKPPHAAHLFHGDVQLSNVMASRGEVVIIDFQDLIWGFEIQDAWIALRAFEHLENVDELVGAFRAGYESVRPWPDGDADTVAALRAARHLNILNYGLTVRGPGLDAFVARHADPVVAWMRGG